MTSLCLFYFALCSRKLPENGLSRLQLTAVPGKNLHFPGSDKEWVFCWVFRFRNVKVVLDRKCAIAFAIM